jgi:hypothetical protein
MHDMIWFLHRRAWSPSSLHHDLHPSIGPGARSMAPIMKRTEVPRHLPFNHITSHALLQNKVRRFYYVCKFYVASRAFAQQLFLTYEHENTTLIIILLLWFPRYGPSVVDVISTIVRETSTWLATFIRCYAVCQSWNQSRVKHVRSVTGRFNPNMP